VKERLGVEVRPVTAREADHYDLESPQGVLITWVDPKGPLGKAGFEVQDILLAIEDQPVESVENFVALVVALQPQEHITISVLDHRSGQTGDVEVMIP
jgi:S1-C subfamily serine protease